MVIIFFQNQFNTIFLNQFKLNNLVGEYNIKTKELIVLKNSLIFINEFIQIFIKIKRLNLPHNLVVNKFIYAI